MDDHIVLFDGECGFCNRSVAYIFAHEKELSIVFAPIQSDYTKELFKANNWETANLNTFYFIENGRKFEKSTAAMKVFRRLKRPYSWLIIFRIIPRFIRDIGYNFIAKRRTRLAKPYCFLPSDEQKKRFRS